jgi:nucleotide-binding universal stress UspA family protein
VTAALRRILLATDFSEASDAAVALAADLARRFSAQLILFHAHAVPSFAYPDGMMPVPSTVLMDLEHTIEAELSRVAAGLRAQGIAVETCHAIGPAAAEICRAAGEHGAELIVMGTHGRGGLRYALLGSVAEKVVRHATCPVLTVHPDEHPAHAATHSDNSP